jgi:hypothetical protein
MTSLQQALQAVSFLPLRLVLQATTGLELPHFKGSTFCDAPEGLT